jgi:hypothetical protein
MTRILRRNLLLLPTALLILVLGLACSDSEDASDTTPGSSPAAAAKPTDDGRLLVADTTAQVVYVYDVPKMTKVAEFPNIKLSTHLGAMALPDGRALLLDELAGELLAIQTLGDKPEIVGRARATSTLTLNTSSTAANRTTPPTRSLAPPSGTSRTTRPTPWT